jgi:phage gp29-like protein
MSLSAFLAALQLIPQVVSLVNSTVQEMESVLSGFAGNAKFAAVEAKVNSILTSLGTDANVVADLQTVIGPLINAAVAAFNASGLFKKAAPAAAAA